MELLRGTMTSDHPLYLPTKKPYADPLAERVLPQKGLGVTIVLKLTTEVHSNEFLVLYALTALLL